MMRPNLRPALLRFLIVATFGVSLTIVAARADFGLRPYFGSKSQFPCADGCGGGGGDPSGSGTAQPPVTQQTPEEVEQQRREDSAARLKKEGVRLFNQGDYDGAIANFQGALGETPKDRNIVRNLAQARAELAFRQGDLNAAISHLQDAIDLGRTDLNDRLNYFKSEEIARHDARLRAAYRGVIERDNHSEPPVPVQHSSQSIWASMKQSMSGHTWSYFSDVMTGGIGKDYYDAVDNAQDAGGIFKRYVVRLYTNAMGSINAFFRGDAAAIDSHDQDSREGGRLFRSQARQHAAEQVSGSFGQESKELLKHKFGD